MPPTNTPTKTTKTSKRKNYKKERWDYPTKTQGKKLQECFEKSPLSSEFDNEVIRSYFEPNSWCIYYQNFYQGQNGKMVPGDVLALEIVFETIPETTGYISLSVSQSPEDLKIGTRLRAASLALLADLGYQRCTIEVWKGENNGPQCIVTKRFGFQWIEEPISITKRSCRCAELSDWSQIDPQPLALAPISYDINTIRGLSGGRSLQLVASDQQQCWIMKVLVEYREELTSRKRKADDETRESQGIQGVGSVSPLEFLMKTWPDIE